MKETRTIATVLTLAVAFCFALVSLVQAECLEVKHALYGLENTTMGVSIPIWKITQDGTALLVEWQDHAPNPRFAIHNAGTDDNLSDDLVLDKETGLVWARDASSENMKRIWQYAIEYCRNSVTLGNRKGWRLPTVEELASLIDPSQSNPALPTGHPFINVQSDPYWSSTTTEWDVIATPEWHGAAWTVVMSNGSLIYTSIKNEYSHYVWPVRGGNGYPRGNW